MRKGILGVLALALLGSACSSGTIASPTLSPPASQGAPLSTEAAVITLPPPYPSDSRPLAGKLIIITFDPQQAASAPYIAQLDLATRELAPLWTPPQNAWLGGMALSPDKQTLVVVYAPPPPAGDYQYGYPGLFALPGSCLSGCAVVDPQPLVPPVTGDSFYAPAWTPDGRWLYFAHVNNSLASNLPNYSVERVPPTGGEAESVVSQATWPQISPDGQRLAFVAFDYAAALNDLFLAAPDGTGAAPVMPIGTFWAVDAPVFSPDGVYVYFSATGPGPDSSRQPDPPGLSWLERLTGVQVAYANGAPSEWWRLPVAGGDPTRLTEISGTGMSGTFSPDGQDFAFISYSGIGVMRPDGSDLVWVYTGSAIGSVIWLP